VSFTHKIVTTTAFRITRSSPLVSEHRVCDVALWIRRLGAASSLWQRKRRHGEGRSALPTSEAELLGPGSSDTRDGRNRWMYCRLHASTVFLANVTNYNAIAVPSIVCLSVCRL